MYKHINSASRIHAILQAAVNQSDKAIWAVWADVFGVKGESDTATAELVLERLHWFHIELQLLQSQVEHASCSKHLYEGALARIRSIASPLNLPAAWQSARGNLSADVLLAVAFLNEILPNEESAIDPSEFLEITAQVNELEGLLSDSDLPEALLRLITHHLRLIRRALEQYKYFGAKALVDARREALGEIVEYKEVIEAANGRDEVSRLGKIWKHVNTAADSAIKIDKAIQIGHKAWEAISVILNSAP